MGARVTLTVLIPPATPVEGAEILGINHDSWSASHREWEGRTDAEGSFSWSNIDTGTLGDRYTFHVNYVDTEGVGWEGSISERIRSAVSLKVVLSPKFRKLESLSADVERFLSKKVEGRRLLGAITELESTLKENLVLASISLEVSVLENAIRLWLAESKQDRPDWNYVPLVVLFTLKPVNDRLGGPITSRMDRFVKVRNEAVHNVGKESLPSTVVAGFHLCVDVLEALFSPASRGGPQQPERSQNP